MTTWYLRDAQFNRTSKPSGKGVRYHLPSIQQPGSAWCAPVASLRAAARGHIVLHEGSGEQDPPHELRCKRCTRMFAATITDDSLRRIIANSLAGRQNALKRALRRDAQAALDGSVVCRFAIAEYIAMRVASLTLTSIDRRAALEKIDAYGVRAPSTPDRPSGTVAK